MVWRFAEHVRNVGIQPQWSRGRLSHHVFIRRTSKPSRLQLPSQGDAGTVRCRVPCPSEDGDFRWISAKGKFYFTPNGEPERMLGMATDITERKRAEEALNILSGQLIKAQEEERSRIAREIHDDYQQRLAMLSIDLEDLASIWSGLRRK